MGAPTPVFLLPRRIAIQLLAHRVPANAKTVLLHHRNATRPPHPSIVKVVTAAGRSPSAGTGDVRAGTTVVTATTATALHPAPEGYDELRPSFCVFLSLLAPSRHSDTLLERTKWKRMHRSDL